MGWALTVLAILGLAMLLVLFCSVIIELDQRRRIAAASRALQVSQWRVRAAAESGRLDLSLFGNDR